MEQKNKTELQKLECLTKTLFWLAIAVAAAIVLTFFIALLAKWNY